MKIQALLLVPLVLLPLAFRSPVAERASALDNAWKIDTVHSTVMFKVKHFNTSWTFGRFDAFTGEVVYDEAKPENGKISCQIDVDSIDTNNKKRDSDLKGQNFFSVKEFPTMTFASTKLEKKGDGFSVTGDLTLHGVKKPVTFAMTKVGASKSEQMGERMGFFGTTTLKRSDYGMKFMLEGVGDEIEVTLAMELTH